MFIQLNDDGQKFVVAYANWSNNKTNTNYERVCFCNNPLENGRVQTR